MKKDNSTQLLQNTWSRDEHITLSVIISIIMSLSFVGNLLIIIVLLKARRMRCIFANQLVLSLAITDLTTAFFPMNYQLATFVDVRLISNEGLLCTAGGLVSYVLFLISLLTLVMLSLDRFMALGKPLKYNLNLTVKLKVFMLSYPWFHGVVFGILLGVFIPIKFDSVSMDCGLGWKQRELWFIVLVFAFNFTIPFVLLAVVNVLTFRLVRRQNKILVERVDVAGLETREGKAHCMSRKRAQSEMKLAKISMTIILAFLLCWTPYIVTRGLSVFCCKLHSIVLTGAILIIDLNSLANPMIYSSLRSDLRQSIRNIFRRKNKLVRVHPVIEETTTNL